MRILQVIPVFSDFFGGPVFDVRSISKRLAKKHELTIYTTTACNWDHDIKSREEWIDGYHVVYFPRILKHKMLREIFLCTGMNGHLKRTRDFDVIHLHTWRQYMEAVVHRYARKHSIPYIHQAHGSLKRIESRGKKCLYDVLFGYRVLRQASKVIALSDVEAKEYEMMGIRGDRIVTIPNGIELEDYGTLPIKGTFKNKYGISSDRKIILYLGRIHRTKGIGFLTNAYAHLLKDSAYKNTLLVIAGPDDGYLAEIRRLVSSLGITRNVLFTGLLSGNKIEALVDASICAYLRPDEPFGRVSLEAAASGTPVVVCKGTPMSSIVKDGNFGFSVRYDDVAELVRIFKTVLSNEEVTTEMGKSGRKYIFKNFGWDKVTDKLDNLYEQVVSYDQTTEGYSCAV